MSSCSVLNMLSTTVKNDPDLEGQIEIKYENIPEHIYMNEIKEEPADCQVFKIEKCSVDEELEDLPEMKLPPSLSMLSTTVKNDPDWEGQIEIKYENILEYIDIKEIKEDSADCQEFKIKIKKCNVDVKSEDLPQECVKDEDINRSNHENFDCSNNICLNTSIEIVDTKKCQYSGYNYDDVTNMENHVVAHNMENECSAYQNIRSANLVSPTSNTNEITLKSKVNRKLKRVKTYEYKHCDCGSLQMSTSTHHVNSKDIRENIHKCEFCDYESTLLSTLKSHINSKHTRENIHKCQYCDYGSPHLSTLKSHINYKHTKENMHKCQYCDYGSPLLSTLKTHINSKHTRENIHKCQYCDYGSSRTSSLKCHINSKHTREKIHKCEYCDYESPAISTLKSHINSKHTREKIHKCLYCDYESTRMSRLKHHINSIHTEEEIHKC